MCFKTLLKWANTPIQKLDGQKVWYSMVVSSMLLLFYYLALVLNDCLVTSRCRQFTFGDKREDHLLDESVLLVTEKESMRKGKKEHRP